MKKILLFLAIVPFFLFGQRQDCGKKIPIETFELNSIYTRSTTDTNPKWNYAKKVSFSTNDFDELTGTSYSTPDSLYFLGKTRVEYANFRGERFFYLPGSDFHALDDEALIDRADLAAIPFMKSLGECPDTIWQGAHLWYDLDGGAKYEIIGKVVSYEDKTDTIALIVEAAIQKKPCRILKAGDIIRAKKKNGKPIVFRRGYCEEIQLNGQDKIEILRGEVAEYKGCEIEDRVITFKNRKFKIVFEPGPVKLKKLNSGGRMEYLSNAKWKKVE